MAMIRGTFVGLLGLVLVFGLAGQLPAASHQAAGREKKAEKPAAAATGRHVGTVKAVDPAAATLTVTEKEGAATVSVSEKTTIKKGKESVRLSELKPGDEIAVVYAKEGGKDVAVGEKKG